jgi:co-chaperonin GroES (HSP10)
MGVMQMDHTIDPKEVIFQKIKPFIDSVETVGAKLLLAHYERPQTTKGGLVLAESTRGEEAYQGKAGLIIKFGKMAFDDKDKDYFGDRLPQLGDWVIFRPSDGFPVDMGLSHSSKVSCRILEDVRSIKGFISAPDLVW